MEFNKTQKIILVISIIIIGLTSFCLGMNNLLKYGGDCQIEGSGFLIKNLSPYKVFLENKNLFRFTRIPTHLPQEYYLLSIFAILGDYWGYFLYGIIGAMLLFIYDFKKTKDKNFIVLIFLLFATTTYRNNLGNGQFLVLYLGIFLYFDKIISSENYNKLKTYVVCPILLLLLASKPTIFFWIPLFYSINKKTLKIYTITLLLQILVILVFTLQTKTNLYTFFNDYFNILNSHSNLNTSVNSVFSINFSNLNGIINGILVIFNIILILLVFILKNKINLTPDFYLFILVNLSFIIVYHSNYDSFLLLIPLFISSPQKLFVKTNYFLISLLFFMIFEKVIFFMNIGIDEKYFINLITILSCIIHIINLIFINSKRKFLVNF